MPELQICLTNLLCDGRVCLFTEVAFLTEVFGEIFLTDFRAKRKYQRRHCLDIRYELAANS